MNNSIDITYLGHATFCVSSGDTNIILDPILMDGYGHNPDLTFKIWPPRRVKLEQMPKINAVVLSHEHLDHFHIPSLDVLSKDTLVITGILTPTAVTNAINEIGLEVKRLHPGEVFNIGDIELQLFPAGAGTIFWEQRVSQILVRRKGVRNQDIFFTVDALLSEVILDEISKGTLDSPRMVCVMNNSQVVPKGALGAYSNLLPIEQNNRRGDTNGIQILEELIINYLEPMSNVPEVILAGNGYISPRTVHGPFLYGDHPKLANIANELQDKFKVYGPRPGDQLRVFPDRKVVSDKVDWIEIDIEFEASAIQQQHDFLKNPYKTDIVQIQPLFINEEEKQKALKDLEAELPYFARGLMGTRVGELAGSIHEHINGFIGPQRMLLWLLDGPEGRSLQYAWDFANISFVPVEVSEEEALSTYPFGLKCYFRDFVDIIRGEHQIWDLSGIAMQAWYVGSVYDTMIPALYKLYGEQMRPDLAEKVYNRAIKLLKVNPAINQ